MRQTFLSWRVDEPDEEQAFLPSRADEQDEVQGRSKTMTRVKVKISQFFISNF